ncbi:hypothetical protein FE257_008096 [Aspergillus nanangensis]|uniref:N-acetyltransferase domain-containing protein n=1 Tax=Aspergillus nanangensis TaxID=2582783 RepID=A0AAD4GTP8_ASPNN|nr:hypothetical protein FE257_008096 [Aspergillus nanangensis]
MPLTLTEAREADALRITEIHIAAFRDNPMLLAQFPTPTVLADYFDTLVQKARDEIRDPKWAVLVVCDQPEPKPQVGQDTARVVISFAKWRRPIEESRVESYIQVPWEWPAGTRFDILEQWSERVEAAARMLVGAMPYYNLSYIATDPVHSRRGAGSMLVKWGIEQATKEGVLVALESTKNASPFYTKLGFKEEGLITMVLEEGLVYEEMCFVWRS